MANFGIKKSLYKICTRTCCHHWILPDFGILSGKQLPSNQLLSTFAAFLTSPSFNLFTRRETILGELVWCYLIALGAMWMIILIYEYFVVAITYGVFARWANTSTMGTFLRRITNFLLALSTLDQHLSASFTWFLEYKLRQDIAWHTMHKLQQNK